MGAKRKHYDSDSSDSDCIFLGTAFPTARQAQRQAQKAQRAQLAAHWQPRAFTSSRTNRAKIVPRLPEDYMDDEDKAAAAIHALSSDSRPAAPDGLLPSLALRLSIEIGDGREALGRGERILASMGWRPGQGLGPLVGGTAPPAPTPMFAPGPTTGAHGVGYGVAIRPARGARNPADGGAAVPAKKGRPKWKVDAHKLSFGTPDNDDDVLPATGSPRPRSHLARLADGSYRPPSRTVGAPGARGYDGRLPLPGFVLVRAADDLPVDLAARYPRVDVPASFSGTHRRASRWDQEAPATSSAAGGPKGARAAKAAPGGRQARSAALPNPSSTMMSRFARAGEGPSTRAEPSGARESLRVKREVLAWTPSRLLSKRMGVAPLAQQLGRDEGGAAAHGRRARPRAADFFVQWTSAGRDSAPIVPATDDGEPQVSVARPEVELFRSIFGS